MKYRLAGRGSRGSGMLQKEKRKKENASPPREIPRRRLTDRPIKQPTPAISPSDSSANRFTVAVRVRRVLFPVVPFLSVLRSGARLASSVSCVRLFAGRNLHPSLTLRLRQAWTIAESACPCWRHVASVSYRVSTC